MTNFSKFLMAFMGVAMLLVTTIVQGEQVTPYQPVPGDKAVIYTHRFKPADFEKGRTLLEESFGAPLTADGRSRRTFFLSNAKSNEVLVVSFFHSDSSVEDWDDTPAQTVALTEINPLHSEPVIIEHYTVGLYHAAD